jgi:hypothetical protein
VHTCHLYISTCAPFVDLDIFLNAWHSGLRIDFCLFLHFQAYVFFIYTMYVIECNKNGLCAYKLIQLSATDLLALASMKNAAKCDK